MLLTKKLVPRITGKELVYSTESVLDKRKYRLFFYKLGAGDCLLVEAAGVYSATRDIEPLCISVYEAGQVTGISAEFVFAELR